MTSLSWFLWPRPTKLLARSRWRTTEADDARWRSSSRRNRWLSWNVTSSVTIKITCQMSHVRLHCGIIVAPEWFYSGITVASRWHHSGVTVASQWLHSDITVASEWRHSGVTLASQWRHSGFTVVLQWHHSGIKLMACVRFINRLNYTITAWVDGRHKFYLFY